MRRTFLVLLLINFVLLSFYLFRNSPSKAFNGDRLDLALAECRNSSEQSDFLSSSAYSCYLKKTNESLRTNGLIPTSKILNNYLDSNQDLELRGACHTFAHIYGETAVDLGYRGEELLNNCINSCLVGCFHGVGHGYIAKNLSYQEINNLCNPKGYQGGHDKVAACFHGVGHGIVDVLGANLIQNLEDCDAIENFEGKEECSHGVFMTMGDFGSTQLKQDLPDNILEFCNTQKNQFKRYCYEFAGYFNFVKNGSSKVGEVCRSVPQENRPGCFFKFGEFAYNKNKNTDPSSLVSWCKQASESKDLVDCSVGIFSALLADGNRELKESIQICQALPKSLLSSCFKELGRYSAQLRGETNRNSLCSELDQPYKQSCLEN